MAWKHMPPSVRRSQVALLVDDAAGETGPRRDAARAFLLAAQEASLWGGETQCFEMFRVLEKDPGRLRTYVDLPGVWHDREGLDLCSPRIQLERMALSPDPVTVFMAGKLLGLVGSRR